MSVQTLDQRLDSLVALRAAVDREIRRTRAALKDSPRRRTPNGQKPPCGTERGYQWHRRHDRAFDDDCRAAHSAYEAARVAQRVAS